MLNENFVYLGAVFMLLADLSYVVNTLKGNIKPNKVSFLLWSLIPFIAFSAEVKQGVGIASLMTLSLGLGTLMIFVASFFNKKAQWKITGFDLVCGALSILGLILWYLTKIGLLAILFSILADFLAAIPTYRKAFFFPETERYPAYLATSFNALIALLTLKQWSFAGFGFPLYSFFLNLTSPS